MPGDNYGQPKNFAVIRRDYSAREAASMASDPWNPFFRFQFASAGAGATLDGRPNGGIMNAQLALGTSITYYHRGQHFREPPNFFNPFWRAGLTKLNVDSDGLDDFLQTFNGSRGPGDAEAKDAFEALRANFFQGWQ
jgi:hypothetical protein